MGRKKHVRPMWWERTEKKGKSKKYSKAAGILL